MRKIKQKGKILLLALLPVIAIFFMIKTPVYADVTNVQDNAHVFSQEDIDKINALNNNDLSKVKGHPQLAVMTVNSTDDIEDYAQRQFDKYHFGRKGLDNGVLLVLAIKNHKIRIQTGYGVEDAIPDVWAGTDATNGEPKDLLRQKKYGPAAYIISKRIVKRLADNEGVIKTRDEIKQHQEAVLAAQKRTMQLLKEMGIGLVLIFIGGSAGAYISSQKKKRYINRVMATETARKYLDPDIVNRESYEEYFDNIWLNNDTHNNPDLAAEYLTVIWILRNSDLKHQKYLNYIIKNLDIDEILDLLNQSSLDHLRKNTKKLAKKWPEIYHSYQEQLLNTLNEEFNVLLASNNNGKSRQTIYDKNNKQELCNRERRMIEYIADKYSDNDSALKQMLLSGLIDPNGQVASINKADFEDELIAEMMTEDREITFDKIRHDPELKRALRRTDNQFNLEDAYRHLSLNKQHEFVRDLDSGEKALAIAIIVKALLELKEEADQEARREEEEREREDNDDNDSGFGGFSGFGGGDDFGGGSFGDSDSFGGFGGDSGGGGATSDW